MVGNVGTQAHVDRIAVQLEHAALGQRQRAQIVDQPREQPNLLQQWTQMFGVGRIHAVDHHLRVSLKDGDGRAQLMGYTGQLLPALELVLPQSVECMSSDQMGHQA